MVTQSKRSKQTKDTRSKKTTSRRPKGTKQVRTTRTRVRAAKPTRAKALPVDRPPARPMKYIPQEIEKKWQARWEASKLSHTDLNKSDDRYYFLTMYPYPSGDLHIGHWYAMAPSDVRARYLRMKGKNVFFPMGFDAFGLPAENAAIRRHIHPFTWTMQNIDNMRRQMRSMGASFDWEREVVTCDPRYYRWNQWFFVQMYKRGLAYKKMQAVDWCPKDQTVLAREQVIGPERLCERCDTPVIKKELEQWFLRITAYADELLDFSGIDWPEKVKTLQTNWIGRSEGVQFTLKVARRDDPSDPDPETPGTFPTGPAPQVPWGLGMGSRDRGEPRGPSGHLDEFDVFTTRHDTVFGMTFAVLAPEHPLVEKITPPERRSEVDEYVFKTRRETEIDRLSTEKARDGVFTGAYAINPMNGAPVPIWIADYVLMTYGTGAIMGVPAHDERDFDFAKRYGLEIPVVIAPPGWDGQPLGAAYTDPGTMVNSGEFNGLDSEAAKARIADYMEAKGIGKRKVNYRLRDWLISRQRYWGTPIPIVYCEEHGIVPVPEDQLPVLLPIEGVEFNPTGQSPLTYHETFPYTTCPICGRTARRETDTMDTFVDSSWYWFDYLDPYNTDQAVNARLTKKWTPVDQYTGGVEHAVMHLLYSRFWTKVMRDLGLIDYGEPFLRLFNQGTIITRGMKMSKSRGNVVAPDTYVESSGADTVRVYLMFIGPWDQGGDWDDSGIGGVHRWLQRVWTLVVGTADGRRHPSTPLLSAQDATAAGSVGAPLAVAQGEERELRRRMHQTIKKAGDDIDAFRFNTMVAALMEYTNYLQKVKETSLFGTPAWNEAIEALLLMLAPSAPHIVEELWERIGKPYSVHQQRWPAYDPAAAAEELFTLVVQVNGKVRGKVELPVGIGEEQAKQAAMNGENVQRHLQGKTPKQVIYVPNKLVNIVVGR
jgi:leucyl-tRNA synthetase